MDPNEALEAIRAEARALRVKLDADTSDLPDGVVAHLERLLDNTEALDDWLAGQGFLPAAWAIPGERG